MFFNENESNDVKMINGPRSPAEAAKVQTAHLKLIVHTATAEPAGATCSRTLRLDQTADLLISGRPALPPEPRL